MEISVEVIGKLPFLTPAQGLPVVKPQASLQLRFFSER
jgi:hypothetical protein